MRPGSATHAIDPFIFGPNVVHLTNPTYQAAIAALGARDECATEGGMKGRCQKRRKLAVKPQNEEGG